MLDFKNLRESIKALFGDEKLTPEQAESLGKISGQIDSMEKEVKDFQDSHETLRAKYVELVKNSSFDKPIEEHKQEEQEKTLMDYLLEESKKRNN